MTDVFQHSIEVILNGQAEGGAYVACPNMPDYAYCWFRDGTFIAYAMDCAGEHRSAHRFYNWAAAVVNAREDIVERALDKAAQAEPLSDRDYLHARYTLSGHDGSTEWPNFQLDGFGTWLWGMAAHLRLTGQAHPPADWAHAAELCARYLSGLWQIPNYDCWEEFGDRLHLYTLAAIYGGLQAYAALAGKQSFAETATQIQAFICQHGMANGHFVKYIGTDAVDASLVGLAVPYEVVPINDPVMQLTLTRIATDLRHSGSGVHRYAWDTYYGGGEWVLLTAWLGWAYVKAGRADQARALHQWVVKHAMPPGDLPEQVPEHLIDPPYLKLWTNQRGPIATPLLWSHAMLMILEMQLGLYQNTRKTNQIQRA